MFLAATARPRREHNFDGLIGMWCIVQPYEAKKKSKYHEKGDVYDKACTLDSTLYLKMMKEKVFPAVWEKMPWLRREGFDRVVVQQDGARPHTGKGNVAKLNEFGCSRAKPVGAVVAEVVTQPAQSYDTNINDLAFFSAHNCRFNKVQKLASVDDLNLLKKNVLDTYWAFPAATLEKMWKTKIAILQRIIACKGGNNYKIGRVSKA